MVSGFTDFTLPALSSVRTTSVSAPMLRYVTSPATVLNSEDSMTTCLVSKPCVVSNSATGNVSFASMPSPFSS